MTKNTFYTGILFTFAFSFLAAVNSVHAVSLYKWVDENGRVHYSQTPPEKSAVDSKQVQVKDSNPYQSEQPAADDTDDSKPGTTDAAAKVVETRKENCTIAKQNLETFRYSEQVKQPDGTVITLSDEMRSIKMKEAQALINAYCN